MKKTHKNTKIAQKKHTKIEHKILQFK
jgi:hypothetical protein